MGWPDLPVTISCSQGCAGLIHQLHRGKVLKLAHPLAARGAITHHQCLEWCLLLPCLQLRQGLFCRHNVGCENLAAAAISQHQAALASAWVDRSHDAAEEPAFG